MTTVMYEAEGSQRDFVPTEALTPQMDRVNNLRQVAGGLGHFVKHAVSFGPLDAPDHMSNHYVRPLDAPVEPALGWPPASKWEE